MTTTADDHALDEGSPASPVRGLIDRIHGAAAGLPVEGSLADYIPELADAEPDLLGLAAVSGEGESHEVGDTRISFTIQSISKALVYGLALDDRGVEGVAERVGVEPTGEAFNSIRLEDGTGRPYNPMVNAGAIAVTGLVRAVHPDERIARITETVSRYTGRPAIVDERVYASERDTGHRNRAIAHLLRNFGVIDEDPEGVLDVYFRQCSILVSCHDLAMIGATLANKGVNPITGARAIAEGHVPSVLSVMATCGMYDSAGQWLFDVGLPAKSGVAGGILAVLPGQVGIGAFSPRLDSYGNSVRGVWMCREVSRTFGLHLFDPPRPALTAVRRTRTAATRPSRRRRARAAAERIQADGDAIVLHELHGDLGFSVAAAAARRILADAPTGGEVIVDVSRTSAIDLPGAAIVARLQAALGARGSRLHIVGAAAHPALDDLVRNTDAMSWAEADDALQWCEDRLLERVGMSADDTGPVPLGRSELCDGMTPDEVDELAATAERQAFDADAVILRQGEPADDLLVVESGRVRILTDAGAGTIRLATTGAGTFLGEMGLIEGRPRSASVIAETPVVLLRLDRAGLDGLVDEGGRRTRSKLLMNVAASLSDRLRRTTSELAAG
jgi:glutaminase